MIDKLLTAYKEALFDTDRERALVVAHEALQEGFTPEDILFKLVLPTVLEFEKAVGEGVEINLVQQFMSSQIALEITETLIPRFKKQPVAAGHVVIGTAAGDLHSLGKRIVAGCLTAHMINVTDLRSMLPLNVLWSKPLLIMPGDRDFGDDGAYRPRRERLSQSATAFERPASKKIKIIVEARPTVSIIISIKPCRPMPGPQMGSRPET